MNYFKKINIFIIFALITQCSYFETVQTTPTNGTNQRKNRTSQRSTTSNNRANRSNNRANRNNRNPKAASKINKNNNAAKVGAASVRNTNQQQQENVQTLLNYCINNPSDARCINTNNEQTTTQTPVIVVK